MSNAVKPLGESDLRWLENSESDTSDNDEGSVDGFWKTMNSMGSDARSDRKERSKRRTFEIEQMLGMIGADPDVRTTFDGGTTQLLGTIT